ncbi:MAG: LuxR family transcriptional regulator, partial [Gemmatimonadales bacterium]|nr:LuxR family transcriptional regulator [Gemmatimonadales bacterium]
MQNRLVGKVSVFYLEERPVADEGPFLREERILIEAVAERLGAMAERIAAEQALRDMNRRLSLERKALEEANTALRAVLSQIEEEKNAIRRQI